MSRRGTTKLSEQVRHNGKIFTVTTYGPNTSGKYDFSIKGAGAEKLSEAERTSIAKKALHAMKKKEIEEELAKQLKDINLTIKL